MELADEIRKQGIVIPAPLAPVDAAIMAYLVDQFGEKARWWHKPPSLMAWSFMRRSMIPGGGGLGIMGSSGCAP